MSPKYWKTFVSLGMPPEAFGTHLTRKGAVTHIGAGTGMVHAWVAQKL